MKNCLECEVALFCMANSKTAFVVKCQECKEEFLVNLFRGESGGVGVHPNHRVGRLHKQFQPEDKCKVTKLEAKDIYWARLDCWFHRGRG